MKLGVRRMSLEMFSFVLKTIDMNRYKSLRDACTWRLHV